LPSPHIGSQVDTPHVPDEVQEYPTSTDRQSALHPSPDTKLPSSHTSSPVSIESPHVVEHTLGSAGLHAYPHSTVHADEHPSPSTVLPSSHPSDVVITSLPHTSWQVDTPHAGLLHSHPCSAPLQSSRHPSAAPPSSHASSPASIESPHVDEQLLGFSSLHVYPHSTVHADEHPSSDNVSPSSHPSPGVLTPFPHTSLQTDV